MIISVDMFDAQPAKYAVSAYYDVESFCSSWEMHCWLLLSYVALVQKRMFTHIKAYM